MSNPFALFDNNVGLQLVDDNIGDNLSDFTGEDAVLIGVSYYEPVMLDVNALSSMIGNIAVEIETKESIQHGINMTSIGKRNIAKAIVAYKIDSGEDVPVLISREDGFINKIIVSFE